MSARELHAAQAKSSGLGQLCVCGGSGPEAYALLFFSLFHTGTADGSTVNYNLN